MRVLHISTYDGWGAGIAALRLMEAMNQCEGIEARMLVLRRLSDAKGVVSVSDDRGLWYRFLIRLKQLFYNRLFFFLIRPQLPFSYALSHFSHIEKIPQVIKADVIYIHWVQSNFLNINDIAILSNLSKPVFLFMHDMWCFTGGCHYSMGCEGWSSGCKRCPMIRRKFMRKLPQYAIQKKMQKWNYGNLHIISPSRWLAESSRRSILFYGLKISTIPNTLNDKVFCVMGKNKCRSIFNLPLDKKLVLFGAFEGTRSVFKGWEYVDMLMKRIGNNVELVVFGSFLEDTIDYKVHPIGRLNDEYSMAIIYNAVDVYISPTKAEAFGQTIAESISCGTKVVAFNVGGVPDIINHLDNGYLAEKDNVDDLEHGVLWCINLHESMEERTRLHEGVKSRFSYTVVAEQHVNLINSVSV